MSNTSKKRPIGKDILRRVRWLYVIFLFAALSIAGRIAWIQYGPQGEQLRERTVDVTFRRFSIQPYRGDILSRENRILSTTIPEYRIYADFSVLKIDRDSFDIVSDSLALCLSDFFADKTEEGYKTMLMEYFDNRETNKYEPVSNKKISYSEEKRVAKFPILRAGRFKGGYIAEASLVRFLPVDSLARSVIGSVLQDHGTRGLELRYDSILSGTPGNTLKQKISGDFWTPVPDESNVEPVNGYDIVTTINADIQDVAERELRRQLIASNAEWGTVILMDVTTGEVLAMCNLSKIRSGKYGEIFNNAVRTPVEPGSTFKLATLITLIEDGGMSIGDMVDCTPQQGYSAMVGVKSVRDDHKVGIVPLKRVFEESSNIGFARSVYNIYQNDPARFVDFITGRLGFGRRTGIDLAEERSPYIKHPSDKKLWDQTSLQMMSYGYALEVTPLQTLALYSAVANNGRMMKPMLVKEIRSHGKTIKTIDPEVIYESIASERTIKAVQECLIGVADEGTGRRMRGAAYRAAVKTGTSQQVVKGGGYEYPDKSRDILASFTGYFPADRPKYACIVAIKAHEPTRGPKVYGASVAGPVFREIADRIYASDIALHDKDYGRERKPAEESKIKGGKIDEVQVVAQRLSLPYTIAGSGAGWWLPRGRGGNGGETHTYPIDRGTSSSPVSSSSTVGSAEPQPDRPHGTGTSTAGPSSGTDTTQADTGDSIAGMHQEVGQPQTEYPTVPSVIGMGLKDAAYILERSGFKVVFSGKGQVESQSASAGTTLPPGSEIRLVLKI